jgi:hypothetical protein
MNNVTLSKESIQMINDLQDDLKEMLQMKSNINVIWRMEELQNQKAFQKSADFIRMRMK